MILLKILEKVARVRLLAVTSEQDLDNILQLSSVFMNKIIIEVNTILPPDKQIKQNIVNNKFTYNFFGYNFLIRNSAHRDDINSEDIEEAIYEQLSKVNREKKK